jgi:outer membrane protein
MRNSSRFLSVLALLTVLSIPGAAQEKRVLTIDEAVQVGIQNSKVLRQSESRVEYADAKSSEINSTRLPVLKFAGTYTRLSDVPAFTVDVPAVIPGAAPNKFVLSPSVLNNYNMRLSVQQPLFTGFRLDASAAAADYTVEATAQEFKEDRGGLIYNIKSAYWNLFRANEFRKVADENVETITSHLKDVRNLLDQGMATNNDILTAELQLSDAQLKQINAKNGVRVGMVNLNYTLGIPLSTDIELASTLGHDPGTSANLDSLVAMAIVARPELRAMEARVKATQAGVTVAKSGWWPQLYLTGNYYSSRPNQRILPTTDMFKNTWDVGVTVSLDIWNWGTTLHQVDQAQAQLEQTREAFGQMQDGVTLETTQSYLNLEQAKERIEVSRRGVAQAEENYRVSNRRYNEGLVINSDMLDAAVAVAQAKVTFTQALVDYELAKANLERATGTIN